MPSITDTGEDFLGSLEPGGDVPYLVVSDGRRARWALPTDSPEVLSTSMAVYSPGTLTGLAAWRGAGLAAGAGLGSLLPGSRRVFHPRLAGTLAEIVGTTEVFLAVASSSDGRRLVVGIVDAFGQIRGFAKIALRSDPVATASLQREAANLRHLAARMQALNVPAVLHLGPVEDYEVLAITAISGRPGLHPSRMTRRRVDAAVRIFSVRGSVTTIDEQLDITADHPVWDRRILAARDATAAVADLPVPTGLVHGDFAAWNMLEDRGRVVGVVDWEQAMFSGLPFWDLWHFCVMAAGPGRSNGALSAIRCAARGKGELARAVDCYAAACGVPAGFAQDVLLVYLARTGAEGIEQARAGVEEVQRGVAFKGRLLDELLEVMS